MTYVQVGLSNTLCDNSCDSQEKECSSTTLFEKNVEWITTLLKDIHTKDHLERRSFEFYC